MTTVANGCYRFTLGRFECFALSDGAGGRQRRSFAGSVFTGLVGGPHTDGRVPTTSYPNSRTCLLVRAPGVCALIDAGAGPTVYGSDSGGVLSQLALAGVGADEVDTVILTHAHLGHAGGALDVSGRPAYAKARYVLAEDEWEFYMSRPDLRSRRLQRMANRVYSSLSALQDRVALVAGSASIAPGICAIATPGHSAGHLAISVTSGGEELLCIGDAALAPRHLEHPAWYSRYDLRPEQAVTSRVRLLDRAAASGALAHAFHFPFPGLGWIRTDGRVWRWEPMAAERRS